MSDATGSTGHSAWGLLDEFGDSPPLLWSVAERVAPSAGT